VALRKSAALAGPKVWTVAELGAFYTEHRSELLTHANRVLRDSAKAEEITQDALIKFMLAAPELESNEHALSYLHRTIENLCIDFFRFEGRRPNLVVLDEATAEIEAAWQNNGDHSAALTAAEDAVIVREALAMLSSAERAALVMWEVEGRSTEEIAAELGIKSAAVRHTVSRARASLRRILSERIIDEERGLTALDLLSTSYKRASNLAKKSSKVALSLLLIVAGFLGYNSMAGGKSVNPVAPQTQVVTPPTVGITPTFAPTPRTTSITSPPPSKVEVATARAIVAQPTPRVVASIPPKKASGLVNGFAVKSAPVSFLGLDTDGIPTGFTITDSANKVGRLFVSKDAPTLTDSGIVLSTNAMTLSDAPNLLISQNITVDGSGTSYSATAGVGINGNWAQIDFSSITTNMERLPNGQYLMTVTMIIDSATNFGMATVSGRGYDLKAAPKAITTRLLLTSGKTQILAQAISVSDSSKGATT
jgi:RNA polymerase sigma factor (sigma-70 family)